MDYYRKIDLSTHFLKKEGNGKSKIKGKTGEPPGGGGRVQAAKLAGGRGEYHPQWQPTETGQEHRSRRAGKEATQKPPTKIKTYVGRVGARPNR